LLLAKSNLSNLTWNHVHNQHIHARNIFGKEKGKEHTDELIIFDQGFALEKKKIVQNHKVSKFINYIYNDNNNN